MPHREERFPKIIESEKSTELPPDETELLEDDDFWALDDEIDSKLSPDEALLRDAIGDIEGATARIIHVRSAARSSSKAALRRELGRCSRLMAAIGGDLGRLAEVDLDTSAQLAWRFRTLLELAITTPNREAFDAGLAVQRSQRAKAEDMRAARAVGSSLINGVIERIADNWIPHPNAVRSANAHGMAADLLPHVQEALAADPEICAIARKSGKRTLINSVQTLRKRLIALGYPTDEQKRL